MTAVQSSTDDFLAGSTTVRARKNQLGSGQGARSSSRTALKCVRESRGFSQRPVLSRMTKAPRTKNNALEGLLQVAGRRVVGGGCWRREGVLSSL